MDTAALVAAFRSDAGASRMLLVAALERRLTMLASTPLFIEYEAVLSRPQQLAASGLTVSEVATVLDALAAVVEPIHPYFALRPAARDPDDEFVLEAAVNGRADAIVTFNRRDFAGAAARFGVGVWSPAEALRRLEVGE